MTAGEMGIAGAPFGRTTGRAFVHPIFDYLVIGGGLSLLVVAAFWFELVPVDVLGAGGLAALLLVANIAHFGSSTVRLYTIRGARATWPFLTMGLPLVSLLVLTLVIWQAAPLGVHFQKLYLTWSPFHYAAQAYGLAVMYAYRSGCRLSDADKRILRWASLLPFLWVLVAAPEIGLRWLLPGSWFENAGVAAVSKALFGLTLAAPFAVFARFRMAAPPGLPAICALLLLANGLWWLILPPLDAFVWATVFHGIQYLAIVLIFNARDAGAAGAGLNAKLWRTAGFYAMCALLGYALFRALPLGYVAMGFGAVESMLMVTAAINIHHFVVDAFIWRLGAGGSNRRIVEATG